MALRRKQAGRSTRGYVSTRSADSQDLARAASEPVTGALADYPQTMNKEVIFRG